MPAERVLVTGSRGMLAGHLVSRFFQEGWEVCLTDMHPRGSSAAKFVAGEVSLLDITDAGSVRRACETFRPTWIVNGAAYTAVDSAETQYTSAFRVNAYGPGNLARIAGDLGARFLHFSTDYIFGSSGERREPWREEDTPAPCSIYGHSKWFGDELVSAILPERSLIVRTSWLHGLYGPNFVTTILRAAAEKSEIRVVNDQIGSPTWAEWLGSIVVLLMKRGAQGIFHASSRGEISWFDYAQEIARQRNLSTRVLPQSSAELGRRAPRPSYSTLSIDKLEHFLGVRCIDWRQGIREHLEALEAEERL